MKRATRSDLIYSIREKGYDEEVAPQIIIDVIDVIRAQLLKQRTVKLQRLGSFTVRELPARKKPMFDKEVDILPKLGIKFTQSKTIREDYLLAKGVIEKPDEQMKNFRKSLLN